MTPSAQVTTGARSAKRRNKSFEVVYPEVVDDVAVRPRIRVLDLRKDGSSVVELRTSLKRNPIWRVFRAISALGLQLVHTDIKPRSGNIVQRLYLLEGDGSALTSNRLSQALTAVLAALAAG
jgi:UTP:GlnB (protein PII) uridylyltransferase